MFKKKEVQGQKAPPSTMKKVLKWTGYTFGGLIVLGMIFGEDGGSGDSYAENGSAAQKYFIALQKTTKASFESSDTDAKKKLAWIGASRALCSSSEFNAYGLQQGWVGKVKKIKASDSMDLTVTLQIDGYKTKILESAAQSRWTEKGLYTTLLDLKEGDMVKFSGQFRRGDMEGDNECLDEAGFGDNPEFSGQTLLFNLARIAKEQ